ncbi:beta strand repeat-containing protein, partial [Pseudomonadota bacterium]
MKKHTGKETLTKCSSVARMVQRALYPHSRGYVAGVLVACLSGYGTAIAAPEGGVVAGGQGAIQQVDKTTIVNQQSQSLAIDWNSFNLAPDEAARFNQPSSSATVLNRIVGQMPSEIFGRIDANGRVFLVNPNGVIFGKSSVVNVGSLLASGLSMDPQGFMRGDYSLYTESSDVPGKVVNRGLLQAAVGGSINLIGGAVANEGVILAELGQVNMGAGRSAVIDFDGDGLIGFAVSEDIVQNLEELESAVSNTGEISADGGQVLMEANVAKDVFNYAVNNTGIVRANRVDHSGGVVRLLGSGAPVVNSGSIDVSGKGDSDGGTVHMLGDQVGLLDDGSIDASGSSGGGTVLVGGEYQGGGSLKSAQVTYMGSDTSINADATQNGDGGRVIVWADNTARVYGDISARGGEVSGDGGFIETSGKKYLDFQGRVDANAVNGGAGTWLLDPEDITISTSSTTSNIDHNSSGDPEIFSPTGSDSSTTIHRDDILAVLNVGTNVKVTTTGAGGDPGNITLTGNLRLNDGDNSNPISAKLTLEANGNIEINERLGGRNDDALSVELVAGLGVSFGSIGWVDTNGGSFSSSGTTFNNTVSGKTTVISTLGGNVILDHSGTVDLNTMNTGTGTLNLTAGGAVNQTGVLEVGGTTTLEAYDGVSVPYDITLEENNVFGDVVSVTRANGVSLKDTGALTLGAWTVDGNLVVESNGQIDQSGVLDINGTSEFKINLANTDILLDTQNNDFTGAITVTDVGGTLRDFQLKNISATAGFATLTGDPLRDFSVLFTNKSIELPTLNLTGALAVTAGGAITQATATTLTVAGDTTLDALGNNITLDKSGNDLNTVAVANGNAITLVDIDDIVLGAIGSGSAVGSLSVTSSGAITQSGILNVTNATVLAAGAGNNITLNTSANTFGGAVSITTGNDVLLQDADAIELGAIGSTSAVNSLGVTSSGAITQSGILDVTNATVLAAGAGNNITLNTSANTFGGAVSIATGNDVLLQDADAIELGAIGSTSAVNSLGVTSSGAITQSGILDVTNATVLAAGAGNNITLNTS